MERDLTSGSVFKTVVYFSLPYLLSYFLQTLYGMADLFIVGQFGGVSSTTVRRSQQYDSSVDRKSDHAYVNGNDSGTCHGFDSDDRS